MTASTADHPKPSTGTLADQSRVDTLTGAGHSLAVLQLLFFGFHPPLLWLAANLRNGASYPDVLLVAGVSVAVALLWYSMLGRWGATRHQALASSSAALLAFWYWESLALPLFGVPTQVGALILTATVLTAAYVNAGRRLFRLALFWTGTVLFAVSVILIVARSLPVTISTVSTADPTFVPTVDRTPDIYFVVLDGYARRDVLEEIYNFDNGDFEETLQSNGFEIASGATANYSVTHFSLASTLAMDYVMDPAANVTRSDLNALRHTLVEDNATRRFLRDLDYEVTWGSEAWWGTECSRTFDNCLPTPLLTRTTFELLKGTPLGPLVYQESGDVATALTVRRLGEMSDWDPSREQLSSKPDFVFLHFAVPHPPLFLDAACRPRVDERGDSRVISPSLSMPPSELDWRRHVGYVDQVRCANLIVERLIDKVDEDAAIVLISDHGPDSYAQLLRDPASLSQKEIWERMSVLAATRLPEDCDGDLPQKVSLVNLMPLVMNCLFGSSIPMQPDHYYLAPPTKFEIPLHVIDSPNRVAS